MILLVMGLSLLGIVFGYLLGKIAPEELKPGNKYFILFKRIMFILVSLFVIVYFIQYVSIVITLIFVLLAIVIFVLLLKMKNEWLEILPFVLFLSAVIFHSEQNFYLVLSSLIFVYGLPVGTLIRK